MFMIRNVSKYIWGPNAKESLIEVSDGQLFLVRPLSPKGYSELIFRSASASIRRTGQDFQYQLVISRIYEPGEKELEEEDEDGNGVEEDLDKDEKTFLLDEALHFRIDTRDSGETVFAWRDLSGDPGDVYEFICEENVQPSTVATFELVAAQCQYERKFRKPHDEATERDLHQFNFNERIPSASPTSPPSKQITTSEEPKQIMAPPASANTAAKRGGTAAPSTPAKGKEVPRIEEPSPAQHTAPPTVAHPEGGETLVRVRAELHLFDPSTGEFRLQDDDVVASVTDQGKWQYWLHVASADKDWLGQSIGPELNPVFNFEYLSAIFNTYYEDHSAYSWLLRFSDQTKLEAFQEELMRALWEHLNEMKWAKVKDMEREYVLEAFNDLTMDDEREAEAAAEDEAAEEADEEDVGHRSEHYDSDESEDDVENEPKDGEVNSQLAVGYAHDRSFVVRGSKIGVFKHTPDNQLQFSTNISQVQTPKGKLFSPKKVMLHAEDRNMILQNESNPNSLYRMDLEYGKVIDEWKVHDDIPVNVFAPESKFSQMTGEQTFLGLSNNALYRIDPRLAGEKLVDSELKQYATKNGFSAAATTDKGHIAVASTKGDIRLFDRLGINAKTHIPALGDPIIGLDVSADGKWVLATTKTYLLLIDAEQKDGKNVGKLGFEKSFAKDSKPQPRRLALTPSHVAQFQHETKTPISFTTAHFNTGVDAKETTIVTSTGPFVITWSLDKLLKGRKDPYSIKRYTEDVKADNFRFGSDKNMIIALPNQVDMLAKRALKRPTRESIAASTPVRKSTGRRSYLGRNEVVNSPY